MWHRDDRAPPKRNLALTASNIVLALDKDDPGTRAREDAYRILTHVGDPNAMYARCTTDLAVTLQRQGPAAVRDTLGARRPAIDAIIDARLHAWPNRSENAEVRIACLRTTARLVADLEPDEVARQVIRLRDSTKLPMSAITRELAEAMTSRAQSPTVTRTPTHGTSRSSRPRLVANRTR